MYSAIQLSSHKCAINSVFSFQLLLVYYLQFVDAVIRENRQPVQDRNQLRISSDDSSSTPDWLQNFQNSQKTSKCSETGPSVASRPDRAVPSFFRTAAVPPPPTNVENLHLSQMFQASCPSSQPVADSAYPDWSDNNAERLDLSDFVSPHKERNPTDSGHLPLSQAGTFKVPYKNTKPVAKVSRQETRTAVYDQQFDSRQITRAGNQKTSHNPSPVPEGNSIANTPYIQSGFSGLPESGAMTPYLQDSIISSSATERHRVGDTPLALSGM